MLLSLYNIVKSSYFIMTIQDMLTEKCSFWKQFSKKGHAEKDIWTFSIKKNKIAFIKFSIRKSGFGIMYGNQFKTMAKQTCKMYVTVSKQFREIVTNWTKVIHVDQLDRVKRIIKFHQTETHIHLLSKNLQKTKELQMTAVKDAWVFIFCVLI